MALDDAYGTRDCCDRWVVLDAGDCLLEQRGVYLPAFMDLYSRAIVDWAVDGQMTEALINSALDMALSRRKIKEGLIVHSDQGIQYRAHCYQGKLRRLGCQISMSRQGDCWGQCCY